MLIAIIVSVTVVLVGLGIAFILIIVWRRSQQKETLQTTELTAVQDEEDNSSHYTTISKSYSLGPKLLNYSELVMQKKIGRGNFGEVSDHLHTHSLHTGVGG